MQDNMEIAEIMDNNDLERVLTRMAHQIVEKAHGAKDLCLVGIITRGVPLAKRLASKILLIENIAVPVGSIDITLYRDDLTQKQPDPIVNSTNIDFDIKGKTVVLVDDVIFTCRTARAALDALKDVGRAGKILLAVLVDRGHAELPIKPNFVGKNIPTAGGQMVKVCLYETDGKDGVYLCNQPKNNHIGG